MLAAPVGLPCPSSARPCTAWVGSVLRWIWRQAFLASFVLSSHTPHCFLWQLKALPSLTVEKCVLCWNKTTRLLCFQVLWKTSSVLAALNGERERRPVTVPSEGSKSILARIPPAVLFFTFDFISSLQSLNPEYGWELQLVNTQLSSLRGFVLRAL